MNSTENLSLTSFQKSWEEKRKSLKKIGKLHILPNIEVLPRKKKRRVPLRTNGRKFTQSRLWALQSPLSMQTSQKLSKKKTAQGILQARFTFKNTHLTLRDFHGKTLAKTSAGALQTMKKSLPFANYLLGQNFGKICLEKGMENLYFESQGTSRNRKPLFRGLTGSGLNILSITLKSRIPHNGCRPPRLRRL